MQLTQPRNQRATLIPTFLIICSLVFISIFANGYYFGVSDHNEQLPIINRLIDPSYLTNDWFVNQSSGEFARFFYSQLLAISSKIAGLDSIAFLIYLFTLLFLGAATYYTSILIWNEPGAGLIGVLLILYNQIGSLGSSHLNIPILVPSQLAFSLTLVAVYWLLKGQIFRSILLFWGTSLLHPLIGPESLGLFGLGYVISTIRSDRRTKKRDALFIIGAILLTFGILYFIQSSQETGFEQSEIIHILANLRHPWHYVPASWDWSIWIQFLSFVAIVFVIHLSIKGSPFLDWPILGILGFCALGFLSLSWEPSLILTKLQPFRMTVFFQFIGVLYISAYIWKLLVSSKTGGWLFGLALIISLLLTPKLSDTFPIVIAFSLILFEAFQYVTNRLPKKEIIQWATYIPPVLLISSTAWEIIYKHNWKNNLSFFIFGCISLGILGLAIIRILRRSHIANAFIYVSISINLIVISLLVILWMRIQTPTWLTQYTNKFNPHQVYSNSFDGIALWASQHTEKNAVFITPPYLDGFRLKASRAIVVDFKAFPFSDQAMIEWRDRIYDIAGSNDLSLGNNWYAELRNHYLKLHDQDFKLLADKYHAQYVVVEDQQPLGFPLIYSNSDYLVYKVIP